MRIAFVVQRYGIEVNGGAELHCRWVAERMAKHFDVSVITTCAQDYVHWEDFYQQGVEIVNGVQVHRFGVARPRRPDEFYELSQKVLFQPHDEDDELKWMDSQGPYSPDLISFIVENADAYDAFIFFTYLHYTTFHGLHPVRHKSLLAPLAHDEPAIRLGIFRKLFSSPRFILYNTTTERDFVHRALGNREVPHTVVGLGVEKAEGIDVDGFKGKYGLDGPYILYAGRIDELKGCRDLVDYFVRFENQEKTGIKLVLVGRREFEIPAHDNVVELGFLPEEDKLAAIQGANVVVIPSYYESLSIIALEAWVAEKPLLVNAKCHVLRDHCIRSNGGLYYTLYGEFRECLALLLQNPDLCEKLGRNGRAYVEANYNWATVERKYTEAIEMVTSSSSRVADGWRRKA